ncbi:hypothetical protein J1614_001403 [Plenodomus biglobosus]|nr:hypothetical protein J1614_001403 [Plenodomus biglobosus]
MGMELWMRIPGRHLTPHPPGPHPTTPPIPPHPTPTPTPPPPPPPHYQPTTANTSRSSPAESVSRLLASLSYWFERLETDTVALCVGHRCEIVVVEGWTAFRRIRG